jgi:NHLM bacteriocin system ABC transporter ATP-binding protein
MVFILTSSVQTKKTMDFKPKEIILRANKPLLLSKPDCVWVIVSGELEVYYSRVDKQGNIRSSRKYLYSASKGEMLFSLQEAGRVNSVALLAVSSEAKLIEVRKEFLPRLNANQLSIKFEKWVVKMGACFNEKAIPRVYESLEDCDDFELVEGDIAYPTKGLKWVEIQEGACSVYGSLTDNLADYQNITKGIIPVTSYLYIQARSEEVKLNVFSTIDIIHDELSLMLAIHYLQRFFVERLESLIHKQLRLEALGIKEKIRNNDNMIEGSLEALKSIVDQKDLLEFEVQGISSDLLGVCKIIGKEIQHTFEAPQHLDESSHSRLNQLKAIAQVSKIRVRKVILRGNWWQDENGHLLAFTAEEKEPVALIQQKNRKYLLKTAKDPKGRIVDKQVADELDPIAYMFFYSFETKMDSVKKIGAFAIKGLKRDIGLIILAALAGSFLGIFTPILSGLLFDDVIPQADRSFLVEVVSIMVIVGLISALLRLIKGVLRLRVETRSNINIQAALMDHLLRLPVTFFQQYSAGDLTARALGINSIREVLSHTLLTALLSGAFTLVNIILLFYYDSNLAWIGVGLGIVAFAFIIFIGLNKLKYDRQIAHQQGEIQGLLFGLLSGISKIRISGAEKRVFAIWAHSFGKLKNLGFRSENLENYATVFNNAFPLATNMIFFGAIFYIIQKLESTGDMISVGIFMAFITAFRQFLGDSLQISYAIISSLNIIPIFERIKPILEEEPESSIGSTDPGQLYGEIEMNAVTFRYHKDQAPVLKNISFSIKTGEMVAFVGPSGSGKSTIMRLLLGFEEPEAGSIYYDGQAFDSLNRELVRKQVGVVLQNGALMAGSISMNIIGNSELTLEDAMEAVKMAGMDEDIKQMPMGMHTVISEGASTFSGGQKQRLMIARAIVHKPRILFMDEATSALDNRTQNIVSESLERLQATRIVIAHRLSTVINADRIFVVDNGEIVESGNYHELMKKDGLFATLAKRQTA